MGGHDIQDTLPPGFTPEMMLWLFFMGDLTIFNILSRLVTGFGEELGHRGLMFPLLDRINPWVGLIGGGLLWYAWHLPLGLVAPAGVDFGFTEIIANHLVLAIGSICTFTYLALSYVKNVSVFVTAIAHITLNNAAVAYSYFVSIENPADGKYWPHPDHAGSCCIPVLAQRVEDFFSITCMSYIQMKS